MFENVNWYFLLTLQQTIKITFLAVANTSVLIILATILNENKPQISPKTNLADPKSYELIEMDPHTHPKRWGPGHRGTLWWAYFIKQLKNALANLYQWWKLATILHQPIQTTLIVYQWSSNHPKHPSKCAKHPNHPVKTPSFPNNHLWFRILNLLPVLGVTHYK